MKLGTYSRGTQRLGSEILNFGPCASQGHPQLSSVGRDDPTPAGCLSTSESVLALGFDLERWMLGPVVGLERLVLCHGHGFMTRVHNHVLDHKVWSLVLEPWALGPVTAWCVPGPGLGLEPWVICPAIGLNSVLGPGPSLEQWALFL